MFRYSRQPQLLCSFSLYVLHVINLPWKSHLHIVMFTMLPTFKLHLSLLPSSQYQSVLSLHISILPPYFPGKSWVTELHYASCRQCVHSFNFGLMLFINIVMYCTVYNKSLSAATNVTRLRALSPSHTCIYSNFYLSLVSVIRVFSEWKGFLYIFL